MEDDRYRARGSPIHFSVGFEMEENYLSEKPPITAEGHAAMHRDV